MDITVVLSQLESSRDSISRLNVPSKSGVYAIFLKRGSHLPLTGVPENGLLYIGSSTNLATREYHTHFKSGGSGFSTLRRSIGALLKSDLHLDAVPRGKGASPSNYRNYRFNQRGEHALTNWMTHSLEAGICSIDGHYREVEQKLIDNLHPILCLAGWSNPLAKEVKALRKICANEAKARMNSSR